MASEKGLPSRPDVGRLFDPQSVAIVGIKEKIQYGAVLENMLSYGFDRSRLTLVNPFHPEVRGIPCEPVVPEGTDAAFLLLRAALVPDVVSELIDRKVGAAVVVAAGFAERSEEGRERQQRLVTSSERIAICGPNTIGIGNLHSGAIMWGAGLPSDLKPGSVTVVFQSGGMTNLFLQLAAIRGVGIGKFVVAGNEAGTTVADYIDYLATDPATDTIALYFESAKDGRRLREALRDTFVAGKRVIALVAGRSEQSKATVATHTGNIAAGDRWARVLEGFGVAVVSTFDELVEMALLCSRTRPLKRSRVQLLTVSGGESTWMTDLAGEVGVELPPISATLRSRLEGILHRDNFVGNPMDIGGLLRGSNPQQFEDVITACAQECDAEFVALRLNLPRDFDSASADAYRIAANAVRLAGRGCAFLTRASEPISPEWRAFFDELDVPLLQEVRRALNSIALRSRIEATEVPALRDAPGSADTSLGVGSHLLDDLRPLFARFGISAIVERTIASDDDIVELYEQGTGPFVLKLQSPQLIHKTEENAVRLGLVTVEDARRAFGDLMELSADLRLQTSSVIAQEQLLDTVEVLVGGSNDREQGPVVVVGHGGIFAELFGGSLVCPGPLTQSAARSMLARLPGPQLFGNYRGLAACDLDELARLVANFSALLTNVPEGSHWDLNPVLVRRGVTGTGAAVVVDALAVVA